MPFVQRDGADKIVCAYANLQPGTAEESTAENAPEYLAFLADWRLVLHQMHLQGQYLVQCVCRSFHD
ncbi:hypothetical protein J8I29_21250 [Labrys sp. LIt4]|uniref:hypothetical protein n=1 Tax=Labrys sp. LIt4 TaxID=2821355 RepID=UPI001AE0AA2B|nr:hypothetical protein [Labrys sp. LIt4]MBP0581870.1 hypothetical protein [Labrys sp. LIt4]